MNNRGRHFKHTGFEPGDRASAALVRQHKTLDQCCKELNAEGCDISPSVLCQIFHGKIPRALLDDKVMESLNILCQQDGGFITPQDKLEAYFSHVNNLMWKLHEGKIGDVYQKAQELKGFFAKIQHIGEMPFRLYYHCWIVLEMAQEAWTPWNCIHTTKIILDHYEVQLQGLRAGLTSEQFLLERCALLALDAQIRRSLKQYLDCEMIIKEGEHLAKHLSGADQVGFLAALYRIKAHCRAAQGDCREWRNIIWKLRLLQYESGLTEAECCELRRLTDYTKAAGLRRFAFQYADPRHRRHLAEQAIALLDKTARSAPSENIQSSFDDAVRRFEHPVRDGLDVYTQILHGQCLIISDPDRAEGFFTKLKPKVEHLIPGFLWIVEYALGYVKKIKHLEPGAPFPPYEF